MTWLLLLILTLSCNNPTMPVSLQDPPNTPRVVFPDGYAVRVEIAADDETRAQGLMYRDRLRDRSGMIFFFRETAPHSFWMKNTLIPLDMIWIDEQKRIAAVIADVPPCKADPCPNYAPGAPARYVLEVAAGVAKQHQLAVGNVLRFENLDSVVVR